MSNRRQEKVSHTSDTATQGWDFAIQEAKRQIDLAERRIAQLRLSIGSFEDFKKRGEPWPGTFESAERAFGSKSTYEAKPCE